MFLLYLPKHLNFSFTSRSGIPELKNWVKNASYGLWRHKTELSQIVMSLLFFRNSETLEWKNENKKPSYVTRKFY